MTPSRKRTSLTPVQRELLAEFKSSSYPDRHVSPRYRRSAEALVRAGLLKRCIGGDSGWYEITEAGKRHD
jgi:hypothetical protein